LLFIFYKIDFDSFLKSFDLVPWWYFPFSIIITLIIQLLATYRWNLYLPEHSFKELLYLNLISQYYMFLLPSSITADVARITQVDTKNKGKIHVASGLLLDRIIGFLALLFLTAYSLFKINHHQLNAFLPYTILFFTCLFFGFLLLYASFFIKIIQAVENIKFIKQSFLNSFLNNLKDLVNNIKLYLNQSKLLIMIFTITFLFQLVIAASYLLADFIFGFNLSIWHYVIISGLTQIVTMFPLGIAGIGVKDFSFVVIMGYFGILNEKSFVVSIINYPILLFYVFLGFVLIFKKRKIK
jgi:hypothetical protein